MHPRLLTGLTVLALSVFLSAVAAAVPICAGTGHCYDTNIGQGLAANSWPGAATAAGTVSFNGQAGHLLTLNSLAESQFVLASFLNLPLAWIGLFQNAAGAEPGTPAEGAAGGWEWVTGEPFYQSNTNTAADVIFHNWPIGEPNNLGGEDLVHLSSFANGAGYTWNDASGGQSLDFIVEFPAGEFPAPAPIPEPATVLLFGTTAAGIGLARWRQRKRKQQP
jgi:hypothetical protein